MNILKMIIVLMKHVYLTIQLFYYILFFYKINCQEMLKSFIIIMFLITQRKNND